MNKYTVVDWKKYISCKHTTRLNYLQRHGRPFIDQTFNKISLALKTKADDIILIRFHNSTIVSILPKKEYLTALEMLLLLCIKIEYYELCSSIQKEIRRLKGLSRKTDKKVILK